MMQVYKSRWGRKGIRVGDRVPTYAIERKLAKVHVGTPFDEIQRMTLQGIEDALRDHPEQADGWDEKTVRDTVRFAVWTHAENRAEYSYVNGGRFSDVR